MEGAGRRGMNALDYCSGAGTRPPFNNSHEEKSL
jgi:hypothetical protein